MSDRATGDNIARGDVDGRCPRCRRVEWIGRGRMIVASSGGELVCVENEQESDPEWTCNGCEHVVRRPSPLQVLLDDTCAAANVPPGSA